VRSVFDAARAHEGFVGRGEDVVHGVSAHERCRAEGDLDFVAGAVVVAESLCSAFWHADGE